MEATLKYTNLLLVFLYIKILYKIRRVVIVRNVLLGKKNVCYWIDRAVLIRKQKRNQSIIPLRKWWYIDYNQRGNAWQANPCSSQDQNQLQIPFLLFVLASTKCQNNYLQVWQYPPSAIIGTQSSSARRHAATTCLAIKNSKIWSAI